VGPADAEGLLRPGLLAPVSAALVAVVGAAALAAIRLLVGPGLLVGPSLLNGGYLGPRGGDGGHGRCRRRLPLQFIYPFCQLSDRRRVFGQLSLDPPQEPGEIHPPEPQFRILGLEPLHRREQFRALLAATRWSGEEFG